MKKKLANDKQIRTRISIMLILGAIIVILLNTSQIWATPITMSPDPAVINLGGSLGTVVLTLDNADTTSTLFDFSLIGLNRTSSGWIDFRFTNIGGGWDDTTLDVGIPLSGVSEYRGRILSSSVFDFSANTFATNWKLDLQIHNVASWDHPTLHDGNFFELSTLRGQLVEFKSVPEPSTFFILGTGLVGFAVLGRKSFKK